MADRCSWEKSIVIQKIFQSSNGLDKVITSTIIVSLISIVGHNSWLFINISGEKGFQEKMSKSYR